eukprot:jgi/Mesvir1/2121/Mv16649-RA.1
MNSLLLPIRRSCLLIRCISTGPSRSRNAGVNPRRSEPRRDGPRRDEFRGEEPRRRELGREGPRRGEFRRDEPRREEPRREDSRRGGIQRDDFRWDEPPRDDFRRGEIRRDEPRGEDFRRNDFRRDDFRREEPRREEFRRDEAPLEEPRRGDRRRDEPRRDDRRREESRRDEPRREDARRSEPTRRVSKSLSPSHEATGSPSTPTAVLKEGKASIFSAEAPLVFSGAVQRVTGSPGVGDSVILANDMLQPLGWGVFNPHSMYQVRMMQYRDMGAGEPFAPSMDQSEHVRWRLAQCLARRAALGLPSGETNAFRLASSEGDALSGLVIDSYNDHLVISVTAAWAQLQKDAVIRHAFDLTGARGIIWRPSSAMLRKEGVEVKSDATYHTRDQPGGVEESASSSVPPVLIRENGMLFEVNLLSQKTGFYCDQRDNRDLIRTLARGKSVLDLCCFSGGFAVAAALGGATCVTGVDSSSAAIAAAGRNADLNGVGPLCTFVEADVDEWMAGQLDDPNSPRYDIIVLDPPKLAPTSKDLRRALQKYRRLNALAMGLIQPAGGLLLTCSCSGAVTQSDSFPYMLVEAAQAARRSAVQLQVMGAAGCHLQHLTFAEGNYLIASLLHVS